MEHDWVAGHDPNDRANLALICIKCQRVWLPDQKTPKDDCPGWRKV